MQRVCVLGLGYIGLPTASLLATHGFEVLGVDVSDSVVARLRSGAVHIDEPDLETFVQAALRSGRLRVSTLPEPADVFIVAVPTPLCEAAGEADTKQADLGYVEAATRSIVPLLRRGNLVILESTVPPGTTRDVLAPIVAQSALQPGRDVALAHCPERVLPGRILYELVENDRVIGGLDATSTERTRALYQTFVKGHIYTTDCTTAEMVKLMENTYRDVSVAIANEFALLAEQVGIDVWEAIEMANRHPRVNILKPGPGVGGHCIAVDPWFLINCAPQVARLTRAAREINDAMPERIVNLIENELSQGEGAAGSDSVIAVLGLTYKADVDDTRESPALIVVDRLRERGHRLRLHDPYLSGKAEWDGRMCSLQEAISGADVVVFLTDHRTFRTCDPSMAGRAMRRRIVVDARQSVDAEAWRAAGFRVRRLGQNPQR